MARIPEKRAWIDLHVQTECENCGFFYGYETRLQEEAVFADVKEKVLERFEQGDRGHRRCPQCGYLQSWMQKSWKDKWSFRCAMATAFPTIIVAGWLLGWPEKSGTWVQMLASIGYLLLFAVGVLPGVFLADKLIHCNLAHRGKMILPKEPQVTIVTKKK